MKSLLYEEIQQYAQQNPHAIALLAPDRLPLTYQQLCQQIDETVARLNQLGIGRHDNVAIVLPNGPEMASAFLCVSSAAASAPLNPGYREPEFDFYLADLDAKALIIAAGADSAAVSVAQKRGIPVIHLVVTDHMEAGRFRLEPEAESMGANSPTAAGYAQAEDIALVLHTSGTTSRPKMVPLAHKNLAASARHIRQTLQLTPADRCLNVMPLFHIHGLMAAVSASLTAGASLVCTPGFYAPHFFEWLDEFAPTWYTAVPTMHQAILARAEANAPVLARAALRFVRSSSASLPPQVMAALEETFRAPVIEAYGMTEAAHQMACNPLPPLARKAGTVGPAAGPEVAIMNEAGELLAAGKVGEIVICGPNVTAGYANNPEANAAAFTNGWFRTGDEGFLDEDGYLTISGRIKEIINRAGEKISPREVDEVLMAHPAIQQAVAFALPHPQLGEEIAAAVVLHPGQTATALEIRQFAAERLVDFKVPRQLLILDEIPKGPTGKLQRIGLAEKLGATAVLPDPTARDSTPPRTEMEAFLVELWTEVLGLSDVGVHAHFLDLGGDSVLAASLVARIRHTLDVSFSLIELFDTPTIAEQAAKIESLILAEPAA